MCKGVKKLPKPGLSSYNPNYEADCDELGKFIVHERLSFLKNETTETDIEESCKKSGDVYWSISLSNLPYRLSDDKNERDDICDRIRNFLEFYTISTIDLSEFYSDEKPLPKNLDGPSEVWIARNRLCFF